MNLTNLKSRSETQKLAYTAILAAIAFILNFIEIPYFGAPFLRIDLSEAIVIFTVIILGLRYGLMISVTKVILFAISGANGSEIVGLSILLLSSCFLAIVFHLLYAKMKLNIYLSLIIMGILFAVTLTTVNYFITVPFYNGMSFAQMNTPGYLWATISLYFPFNIVKMTLISIAVIILKKLLLRNEEIKEAK